MRAASNLSDCQHRIKPPCAAHPWRATGGRGIAFPLVVLGLKAARHPLVLALAFGVYRFFDGLKPPPIHLAEYVNGGLGIVLDDVIAALVSWLVVALLLTLWQRRRQIA